MTALSSPTSSLLSLLSDLPGLVGATALTAQANSAASGAGLSGTDALWLLVRVAVAAVCAVVAAVVVHVVFKRAGRRSVVATDIARRGRVPVRVFLVLIAVQQVVERTTGSDGWLDVAKTALALALVASVAWLVAVALFVLEDVVLARYRVDTTDNRHARRVRTQVTIVRRVLVGVVLILTVAAMLFTFPAVKQIGAGIFASAGLISVVAGLAAQTSLANIFAGLQLAFTDALRVDDVVVVETEWGRIEELTLTYVVVHLWDDRRLVLPSTYFTTTPFQNWTRKDSQLLGDVTMQVDWATDFDAMREELRRVVEADPLWDRRVSVLQVTDAQDSFVTVRILVSAQDGPTVFDLRCHVREAMVRWLVASDPAGLPRLRLRSVDEAAGDQTSGAAPGRLGAVPLPAPASPAATGGRPGAGRRDAPDAPDLPRHPVRTAGPATPATTVLAPLPARDDSLFTGSLEALARSRRFSGPSEAEQAERGSHDDGDDRDAEDDLDARDHHDPRGGDREGGRPPRVDDDTATRVLPAVEERSRR